MALGWRLGLLLQVAALASVAIPAEGLEVIQLVGAALAERNFMVEFKWYFRAVAELALNVVVALKYLEAPADGNCGTAPGVDRGRIGGVAF